VAAADIGISGQCRKLFQRLAQLGTVAGWQGAPPDGGATASVRSVSEKESIPTLGKVFLKIGLIMIGLAIAAWYLFRDKSSL